MSTRSWKILPASVLGQWSLGLIITMPILFFIGSSFTNSIYKDVPAAGTITADIAARPALALTMLAGMAAGILSFILGLVAVIWQKERTLLVYIAMGIGGLLLVFLAGEFLSPH